MTDPIHDHCRVVGCACGNLARARAADPERAAALADLSPAEQTAYAAIYRAAHSLDHSMITVRDGATCQRCESTARAVVAAVRPHLAAEILTAAANSWPMPWPIEGHDWLLELTKKFQHTADKEATR